PFRRMTMVRTRLGWVSELGAVCGAPASAGFCPVCSARTATLPIAATINATQLRTLTAQIDFATAITPPHKPRKSLPHDNRRVKIWPCYHPVVEPDWLCFGVERGLSEPAVKASLVTPASPRAMTLPPATRKSRHRR